MFLPLKGGCLEPKDIVKPPNFFNGPATLLQPLNTVLSGAAPPLSIFSRNPKKIQDSRAERPHHTTTDISPSKMAKTVEKTRKQIAKKKGGSIDALHEHSRNAKRLHYAQHRDERLDKIARARGKRDQPLRQSPFL